MPPPSSSVTTRSGRVGDLRRYDLDRLRVLALAVLIFYHVGMFFVPWPWHLTSDHATSALEPIMALVHPWRLGLLFVIAGVALRFALDSRGPRTVISDRLGRLLLPLGFGMLVVVMPQAYVQLRAAGEIEPGPASFLAAYLWPSQPFSILTPTWNHLWFLAYLMVYSVALAALHPVLERMLSAVGPCLSGLLERGPGLVLLLPLLVTIPLAVLVDPLFSPTHHLVDDWAVHAESFALVVLGWCGARSTAFWGALDRALPAAALLALACALVLLLAGEHSPTISQPGWLRGVEAGYAWMVIAAVLALARRLLNRGPSAALRYATEAVLVWYILHQTLTLLIGYAVLGSGIPGWLEVALVLLGTVLGCALLHELVIRRVRWVRPLFGLGPRVRTGSGPARSARADGPGAC